MARFTSKKWECDPHAPDSPPCYGPEARNVFTALQLDLPAVENDFAENHRVSLPYGIVDRDQLGSVNLLPMFVPPSMLV